ncbi:Uncharacterised protein [Mycobacteroides abscessus subsp. abscessus]|nr:Uncharacterised protein [Mycobacteroides abscessus subsp. abscessus]
MTVNAHHCGHSKISQPSLAGAVNVSSGLAKRPYGLVNQKPLTKVTTARTTRKTIAV